MRSKSSPPGSTSPAGTRTGRTDDAPAEHGAPALALAADPVSHDTMARLQENAWHRTWQHLLHHSPYYRTTLRQAGFRPDQPPALAEIHRLPTTDKPTLSRHLDEFLCVARERIVDVVTTSGTTGQPLLWQLTDPDLNRLALNERLSFATAGLGAADTVLLAVTLDRCFMAGMAYWLGLRQLGCAVVRVGPALPTLHLDLLQRARPSAIVGVPSFLRLLAETAAARGVDPANCGVRKLICIGEPVRTTGFDLNPAGVALARLWNAEVLSTYGVTELASSLCECPAGRGGHLHPGLLHVEILDDDGRPLPDGAVGELTATTLGVEALPLLRYRTGDCTTLHREPCTCGRVTWRLGPILGRKQQRLKLKGATLFPATLQAALENTPHLDAFIILAHQHPDGTDDVEVRFACANHHASLLDHLRQRCQALARVAPRFTRVPRHEIESLQLPEGARKRRFFVDLRS